MSPHSSSGSERSASSPYPTTNRRVSNSGQPKASGRLQFSACGACACRMRRVRCDLKDWPIDAAGPHPACSNCIERSIKCVDEFAEVKAVKQLRRGRRLQQVEATYGKASNDGSDATPRGQTSIPNLQPSFFQSPFWRWFSLQRPLTEPTELPSRLLAHVDGTGPMAKDGQLLTMLLVVWASSFGVDEHGVQDDELDPSSSTNIFGGSSKRNTRQSGRDSIAERSAALAQRQLGRRQRTETQLKEILYLVDIHSIMRQPTMDGVRVLLLLLPLLEDFPLLEKTAISDSAYTQARALSTPASSALASSPIHTAIASARVYWFAHLNESIATCLRGGGGRSILDEQDFDGSSAGPSNNDFNTEAMTNGIPTPISPSLSTGQQSNTASAYLHLQTSDVFDVPYKIAVACRKIHLALTSTTAKRQAEKRGSLDLEGTQDAWELLDKCWEQTESARMNRTTEAFEVDIEALLSGWQIFIFECFNVIREFLKQYIMPFPSSSSSPRLGTESYTTSEQLYSISLQKCMKHLPSILNIIQSHLLQGQRSGVGANIFKFDSGLVREGCFYAGVLAVTKDTDSPRMTNPRGFKQEHIDRGLGFTADESVHLCLTALGEMRWSFSKSEGRQETLRMLWQDRQSRTQTQQQHRQQEKYQHREVEMRTSDLHQHQPSSYAELQAIPAMYLANHPPDAYIPQPNSQDNIPSRPFLPALTLTLSPLSHVDSAPNTSSSTDSSTSSASWPSYPRPSTVNSTGNGSPQYGSVPGAEVNSGFKGSAPRDIFYHLQGERDVEAFTYPDQTSDAYQISPRHRVTTNTVYLDPISLFDSTTDGVSNYGHFDSNAYYQ